jgi:hypothetical protein
MFCVLSCSLFLIHLLLFSFLEHLRCIKKENNRVCSITVITAWHNCDWRVNHLRGWIKKGQIPRQSPGSVGGQVTGLTTKDESSHDTGFLADPSRKLSTICRNYLLVHDSICSALPPGIILSPLASPNPLNMPLLGDLALSILYDIYVCMGCFLTLL